MVAQNHSQYVSNTGSFSMYLLVSAQGLESASWRTHEAPMGTAELVEAESERRKRGSCCSPKGNVELSNYQRQQQGHDHKEIRKIFDHFKRLVFFLCRSNWANFQFLGCIPQVQFSVAAIATVWKLW